MRPHLAFVSIALLLAASPAGAVTHTVNVTNNLFTPKNLTITAGDVVRWQWVAGSHTTTSGSAPPGNGLWNANLAQNPPSAQQFSRTFTTPGTFPYFCSPHFSLGMTGTITVNPPPNTAPVVTNPGTQNGVEGVLLSFNVSAADSENDSLVMTAQSLPAGAGFVDNGDRTCTITWTPGFTEAGTYPVSVRATDPGGLFDTEPFDIVIANTNRAPVVANPGTQNGDEGVFFTVTVTASDPDVEALTLSDLGTAPAWATFTPNGNNTATLSGTPPFGSAATFPVSVRATDPGTLSDTESFDIVIDSTTAAVVDVQGTEALPLSPAFVPPLVTIDVGGQVAWNWVEGSHTTTSGSSSDPVHGPGALWDQVIDEQNPIFFRTFNDPGVYDYFSRPDEAEGMTGRVVVRATTGIGDGGIAGAAAGLRAFPNPFTSAVDLVFRLEETKTVRVEVFDLGGHRVRRLTEGTLPAGDHLLRWDGEDGAGRTAALGVYLIRVASAGETSVVKVWKTR